MDSNLATILSVMSPASAPPGTLSPPPAATKGSAGALKIRSLLKQWPLAGPVAPAKGAEIRILRLLKRRPQPTLCAIARACALPERVVKIHLRALFRVGLIKKLAFYELTGAGRAWVSYENELIRWELIEQHAVQEAE